MSTRLTPSALFALCAKLARIKHYSVIVAISSLMMLSQASLAQSVRDFPRTPYGHPDLQGTYTYRTLTPMQRPRGLENKATLTVEEADAWQAAENIRLNRDLIDDKRVLV